MTQHPRSYDTPTIDTFIRILLLIGLFTWCSLILAPLIFIVIWGMIIAVTTFPVYEKLNVALGNRNRLSALIVLITGLAMIGIPGYFVVSNVVKTATELKHAFDAGTLTIPHPPDEVETWPIIGKTVHEIWSLASNNLGEVLTKYETRIMSGATWVAGFVGRLGLDLLKFIFSIIVAALLLMYSEKARNLSHAFFHKLMGNRGPSFAAIAEKTIRNVARGIIGVAFIQAAAAGIGFFLGDIPFAGPLTLICLILCIIQIGVGIVVIPVIIYAFSTFTTTHAVLLSSWLILITFSDNILKPIFLSKGAPVPTLIIFLGSIGGFLLSGLIGLFTGAVILALGYRLFMSWIATDGTIQSED